MFIYNDEFFDEIEDLVDSLNLTEESIEDYKNGITVEECQLEPICKINAEWMLERIDEERFPEDQFDEISEKVEDVLNKYIDFAKVNEMLPKLWYGTGKLYKISYDELKTIAAPPKD